jgi:hypothetical protein
VIASEAQEIGGGGGAGAAAKIAYVRVEDWKTSVLSFTRFSRRMSCTASKVWLAPVRYSFIVWRAIRA